MCMSAAPCHFGFEFLVIRLESMRVGVSSSGVGELWWVIVGVGIVIPHNPLHGSGRAGLPHPALALGDDAHAA